MENTEKPKRGLAAMTPEQRASALDKARVARAANKEAGIKTTRRATPRRAIKDKCLDCSSGSKAEVRACPVEDCPLWLYRCKNPHQTRALLGGAGLEDSEEDSEEEDFAEKRELESPEERPWVDGPVEE